MSRDEVEDALGKALANTFLEHNIVKDPKRLQQEKKALGVFLAAYDGTRSTLSDIEQAFVPETSHVTVFSDPASYLKGFSFEDLCDRVRSWSKDVVSHVETENTTLLAAGLEAYVFTLISKFGGDCSFLFDDDLGELLATQIKVNTLKTAAAILEPRFPYLGQLAYISDILETRREVLNTVATEYRKLRETGILNTDYGKSLLLWSFEARGIPTDSQDAKQLMTAISLPGFYDVCEIIWNTSLECETGDHEIAYKFKTMGWLLDRLRQASPLFYTTKGKTGKTVIEEHLENIKAELPELFKDGKPYEGYGGHHQEMLPSLVYHQINSNSYEHPLFLALPEERKNMFKEIAIEMCHGADVWADEVLRYLSQEEIHTEVAWEMSVFAQYVDPSTDKGKLYIRSGGKLDAADVDVCRDYYEVLIENIRAYDLYDPATLISEVQTGLGRIRELDLEEVFDPPHESTTPELSMISERSFQNAEQSYKEGKTEWAWKFLKSGYLRAWQEKIKTESNEQFSF